MIKVSVKEFEVNLSKNRGVNKELTMCNYYSIDRIKIDRKAYNVASDIEINGMKISVKSPKATLMSSTLCNGCKTFEGIWRRYRKNTHSDTFVFVTNEFNAYYMNINEFSKFVHTFGYLHHASNKRPIIALRAESKKMRAWLTENCG